jgi:DNA recombination protein RmuC
VVWIVVRERAEKAVVRARGELLIETARLNERLLAAQEEGARLSKEYDVLREQATGWRDQLDSARDESAQLAERTAGQSELISRIQQENAALNTLRAQLTAEQQKLSSEVSHLKANLEAERNKTRENLEILNGAREELSNQFRVLASEILEDKSKRFTEQNQQNLNQLLEPLKARIVEFQGKVQEVYVQEGKDRSALAEQVKQLMALNNQLSRDAHDLTSALKGQAKTQGNWGELILERVLEASGLRKGHEYDPQESHVRDDGSRVQPDVVVHLPEDKHLVVDAKVSLIGYEEYANAESDQGRESAARKHLESVRAHIRELSGKNYQQIYGLKSLDFVLMFVPIEPAFMLAISHDSDLWHDAWKRNVLLVSPSTLLFVVRTVAHLWKQEQQNRNAQEIASRGAELYDKLTSFVEDLTALGGRLQQAQKAYDGAYSKLAGGRGNVIRQAELLRELGVKPSKQLPQALTDASAEPSRMQNTRPDGD